jgi:hypothetical protein
LCLLPRLSPQMPQNVPLRQVRLCQRKKRPSFHSVHILCSMARDPIFLDDAAAEAAGATSLLLSPSNSFTSHALGTSMCLPSNTPAVILQVHVTLSLPSDMRLIAACFPFLRVQMRQLEGQPFLWSATLMPGAACRKTCTSASTLALLLCALTMCASVERWHSTKAAILVRSSLPEPSSGARCVAGGFLTFCCLRCPHILAFHAVPQSCGTLVFHCLSFRFASGCLLLNGRERVHSC